MKVIHLPTTVGGNPQGISKHLNIIGVESKTLTLYQNYLGYPADYVILTGREGFALREFKKFIALRYVLRYDVVFFNFGTGLYSPFSKTKTDEFSILKRKLATVYDCYVRLMARFEVNMLAMLNKPILIQYQGDDARQGDYCLERFRINFVDRVEKDYYTSETNNEKRKTIAFYEKYASKIYALNPDLLYLLSSRAEFLPYSHISLYEWTPVYTQLDNEILRIGHAPSNRGVKGTDLVIEAINKLQKEGYLLELILVEGMSNAKAKEVYKTVDILVDQLFAGWYGGLAVEAMALGKPVVAYIRMEDLQFIPEQMRIDLPIMQTDPDSIYNTLKSILKLQRQELLDIAIKSRQYVEKWHNPISIANRIKNDMLSGIGVRF